MLINPYKNTAKTNGIKVILVECLVLCAIKSTIMFSRISTIGSSTVRTICLLQ